MNTLLPDKAKKIDELVAAMIEGASDTAIEQLETLLRDDPAAQVCYLRQRDLHDALRWNTDADAARDTMQRMRIESVKEATLVVAGRINAWAVGLAVAAAIALVGAAAGVYFLAVAPDVAPPQPAPVPLATLIENTGGRLTTPHGYASEGREYTAGEYALDAGYAQFVLTNRVTVDLRGDTRLYMHNPMRLSLTRGQAEFTVPRGAEGFTVNLPEGVRVMDLGTQFAVGIRADGSTELAVLDGSVRAFYGDATDDRVGDGAIYHIDPIAGAKRIVEPLAIDPAILAKQEAFTVVEDLELGRKGWQRVYAVNVGGVSETHTIRGVVFDPSETPDGVAGLTVRSNQVMQQWGIAPEFGDHNDAAALASVMHDIRWSSPKTSAPRQPDGIAIDAALVPGRTYRLTLMFAENHFAAAGERTFDIVVEGLKLRDEFDVFAAAGGQSRGVALTYTFIAHDDNLDIDLLRGSDAPDGNPILNALALFELNAPEPDPTKLNVNADAVSGEPQTSETETLTPIDSQGDPR